MRAEKAAPLRCWCEQLERWHRVAGVCVWCARMEQRRPQVNFSPRYEFSIATPEYLDRRAAEAVDNLRRGSQKPDDEP